MNIISNFQFSIFNKFAFSSARRGLIKLVVPIFCFTLFLVLFFAVAPRAFATDRYWYPDATSYTGTGNWSATGATGHWADNSSGLNVGGAVPGTGDNVYFTSTSFNGANQTVTVDATANCKDMDWTGAANSPTLAGTQPLNLNGNLTTIGAGMLWTATGLLISGSGTNIITTGGTNLTRMRTASTYAGTISLADTLNLTSDFSPSKGNLTTNNNAINCSYIETSGTGVRTWTLGSSVITTTTATGWSYIGTNLILATNTATINVLGTGAFTGGTPTGSYYNINLNGTAHTVSGVFTANKLTRNGTDTKTDSVTFTSGTTVTLTDLSLIGNPAHNYDRLLVQSSTLGSPATLTVTNKPTITQTDLMDITLTNAQSYSSQTDVGDAGGNTGFTFPAGVPQTFSNTSGNNWSTAANWTSRVPLPQDDVSAGGTGNTITVDMPRIGKSITFTGTPTITVSNTTANYGSMTLVASTFNAGPGYMELRGRSSYTFTIANKSVSLKLLAPGGTYTLQDNMTAGSLGNSFIIYNGTFDFNDKNAIITNFSSTGGTTRGIYLRSGTITLNGTGVNYGWNVASPGLTFDAGTSTILISNSGTNNQNFIGGGLTYNNVTVAGAGNYALTITGNNTFNTFTVDRSQAAKTVTFTDTTTQTVSNFVSATSGTTVLTLNGTSTAGWNIAKSGGGTISLDYLNISYSAASPANTWYAGANSTPGAGNSGWIFTTLPGSSYKTLVGKGVDSYQIMTDGSTNVYGYINVTNSVSAPLDNTKWHHVAMTYDGTTQKIYVDGVLQSSNAVTGTIRTNGSNIEIGQNFAGKIDDVRIYNRALSQDEVTASYGNYNSGVVVSDLQKGLVGQWKMDGNAKDSTPYANNGTFTSAGEAVTNGNCDSLTGWTVDNGGHGSTVVDTGTIKQTQAIGYSEYMWTYQTLNLVPGATYSYSFIGVSENVDGANEASFRIGASKGAVDVLMVNWGVSGAGTYSGTFTAGATNILTLGNAGASGRIVRWNTITITGSIIISGTLTTDRKGQMNKAYSFNGSSDYIGLSAFRIGGSDPDTVSFSAWVKDSDLASRRTIFSTTNANTSGNWSVEMGSGSGGGNGKVVVIIPGIFLAETNINVVTDSNWHHIVYIRRGSGATHEIYVDGVSKSLVTNGTNDFVDTGEAKQIGMRTPTSTQPWFGSIDDVRIWNRALSQTEITALYDSYNPSVQISDLQKGLIGQWKFDGNAKDTTPYGNDGAVTGAILTANRKGTVNQAYSFNGTTDVITVPSSSSLSSTTAVSIGGWVYDSPSTAGPNPPGTMADDSSTGTTTWSNPDYAKADDTNYAFAQVGSAGCFLAGTKITMGDSSYKNIEEIKVGEIIRSYNTEKKEIVPAPVTNVFHHSAEEMTGNYYLIITTENNQAIKVTINHPIWANGNWINAGNLNVGDVLTDDKGNSDKVTKIEKIYEKVPTYNLEVGTYHTYFAEEILVHNKPGIHWTNAGLVKGGTIQGNNNATGDFPTTEAYVPFGSSSDLWGLSLSPSDINSSSFGFAMSVTGYGYPANNYSTHYLVATNFGFSIPVGATINGILVEVKAYECVSPYACFPSLGYQAIVNHIRITVYYTVPAVIIGKGHDAYSLEIDDSLNVTGYISGSASGSTQITKAWHYVMMTYDGANIKLYVDGVLKTTTAKTGAIATNSTSLLMGSLMAGKLGDMRVYNRVLSQAEITALYDSY